MFKFESFFKKGQEDVKKAAKIGTLAVGIGASIVLGAEKVQAQSEKMPKNDEWMLDRNSPKMYDLSNKKDVSGELREKQENPDILLAENIEKVKLALDNAKSLLSDGNNIEEQEQLINVYEKYLVNPDLKVKEVGDVYFDKENFSKNKEDFEFYDSKIEALIEHVKSPEYLKKLMLEYDIDEQAAKEHQQTRLQNIMHGTYSLDDNNANYETDEKRFSVILPKNHKKHEFTVEHEILGHKTVDADEYSRKAAKLMSKSGQKIDFKKPEFKEYLKKTHGDTREDTKRVLSNYFRSQPERYARKQVLELEMEQLGIKKYGEEFTDEHYRQLSDLYKKGKLSDDSRQFFSTTKPEYFKIIFNEIAENNSENYRHPGWNYNKDNNQENKA
ncbi:MAG: hypothetical protein WCW61_01745 [Patescibacteria group bacterium]|jgi:hypothetical protein